MILPALIKLIWQTLVLLWIGLFGLTRKPVCILSQNPPCLPLFLVLPLLAFFHGASWIIDWHNLGYSILALGQGGRATYMVRLLRFCEYRLGRLGSYHLTVTEALREDLLKQGYPDARIRVCYDHPPVEARPLSAPDLQAFLKRLPSLLPRILPELTNTGPWFDFFGPERERPLLLVSSTSWTLDEDFSLLLRALDRLEARGSPPRPILLLITGKGPMRQAFLDQVATRPWTQVRVGSVWLEPADYYALLGSADVGLSLHRSSSGLDFPMKIIDMLGCHIPVLAHDFPCASELLHVGQDSFLFGTEEELTDLLLDLLRQPPRQRDHPDPKRPRPKLTESWSTYWHRTVLPLIKTTP